jgi:malonyl-CoA/methylmalonyl-CoA synthetase
MNILYRDRELRHIIDDADPVAVVADERDLATLGDCSSAWPLEMLRREAERESDRGFVEVVNGDTPAIIVYTSGTTGAPKGAVLTHDMLCSNARTLVTSWRLSSADRLHLMLPLSHLHGLGIGLHCWLSCGCLLRLEERFDRHSAEQQMTAFEPTLFFGVPAMYVRMLEFQEQAARLIGRRMRVFVSGSAPLPVPVFEAFKGRFGHAILERYGMSETLIITSNPYDGERRPGSVGLPLPGIQVRTVNAQGQSVASGETGELCIRGPSVFRGYWRNPGATANAFCDGWFKTGDLGVRTVDGYVTLQGRRSELIISAGFNIHPREIEDFLCEQPGVAEAAVVGVPDAVRGEVPLAYIVPTGVWDPERLRQACVQHLASFKVPRRFIILERLPRTSVGKVQKQQLRGEETTE